MRPPTPSSDALRAAVVGEARRWLGTPYLHQARVLGVGCDCVGLILAAGIDSGVLCVPSAAWVPFAAYSRTPNPRRIERALRLFLRPCDDPGEGDVGWCDWGMGPPMHLMIRTILPDGRAGMIHADGRGPKRVVEHGFAAEWPDRVHSWWRYPAIEGDVNFFDHK